MQDACKKLLVVEDEVALLDAIAEVLRRTGYEILEAHTSEEAVVICERSDVEVDLILSDFNLPGDNGADLATKIAELRPNLPMVFMSGNTAACRDLRELGFSVLQKPFAFAEMKYTVGETLAASKSVESLQNRRCG